MITFALVLCANKTRWSIRSRGGPKSATTRAGETMGARELLVGVEARRVAGAGVAQRLTGVGLMQGLLAVLGAIDLIGEVAAAQDRDGALDHADVHRAERVGERAAIAAAEIAEHGDRLARRLAPDDRAGRRQAREREVLRRCRCGGLGPGTTR